jgi:Hemocyanin, all-alpha domain
MPSHRAAAYALVDIFMKIATLDELISVAAAVRDQVNESVFVYAWTAALIRRTDTRHLKTPPIWEVFPNKFFGKGPSKTLTRCQFGFISMMDCAELYVHFFIRHPSSL